MQLKQHLLDKRVVARALKKGLLDKKQFERTIESLPDLSDRVQKPRAEAEAAHVDDDVDHDADDDLDDESDSQ